MSEAVKVTVMYPGGHREPMAISPQAYSMLWKQNVLTRVSNYTQVEQFSDLVSGEIYMVGQPQQDQQALEAPGPVLPEMTLDDILKVKPDQTEEDWSDIGHDMRFHGRHSLANAVQAFIENLQLGKPKEKEEKCLVYSSVSGSGKTISFLQLKEKLRDFASRKDLDIVVSYLGFNSRLLLDQHELKHINNEDSALDVLARRLVVSTIISMNNPDVVDKLPYGGDVYTGFKIPPAADSKKLLLDYLDSLQEDEEQSAGIAKKERKPLVIVAGVDEVQMLNRINRKVQGEGLGRHILRTLRRWQWEWYKEGLLIVPLGTGITTDWDQDSTAGTLWDLKGEDATLISKPDFRRLVEEVVRGKENFEQRVPTGTTRETSIELLTAAYWPRVRLLQWWKSDDKSNDLQNQEKDSEWQNWLVWISYWLRDEYISCKNKGLVPGITDTNGDIRCLFEMKGKTDFTVIPDAYSWPSILEVLEQQLPVQSLYNHLNVIDKMDPREFITGHCYEFEAFGFHVISLAIHLGLYALGSARPSKPVNDDNATTVQRQRLGLALWLQSRKVEFRNDRKQMTPPVLVGNETTGSGGGAYFPFANSSQSSFEEDISKLLKVARTKQSGRHPVHVKCGRQTCCDYMYFYVRKWKNKFVFVAILVDSKHTSKEQGGGHSQGVTSNEQKGIYDAAGCVLSAMRDAKLELFDVRLLILSNRSRVADTNEDFQESKREAEVSFGKVLDMKVIRSEADSEIEIGPLADILWARRRVTNKRKAEEM